MISLCTLFSLTGAAFNLTLIVALLKFRQQTLKENSTNIFVLCLAVSDIFLCSVSMPVQMLFEINEDQMASDGLCRILFASFGLPLYISCLTILLIAFDRYRMIVHPMKLQLSIAMAMGLIGLVVLFGSLNSVPVAFYVNSVTWGDFTYCVEQWPAAELRLTYSVCVFVICFILPLAVSVIFYSSIYYRLKQHSSQLGFRKEAERRKRKTTSLLVITMVCFVICWTPWCLYSLLLEIQTWLNSATKSIVTGHVNIAPVLATVESDFKDTSIMTTTASIRSNITTKMYNPLADPVMTEREICAKFLVHLTEEQMMTMTNVSNTEQDLRKKNRGISLIPGHHITLIDLLCKLIALGSTCVNPFLYGWLNEPIQRVMLRQYGRLVECFKRTQPSSTSRQLRFHCEIDGENGNNQHRPRNTASCAHSIPVIDLSTNPLEPLHSVM